MQPMYNFSEHQNMKVCVTKNRRRSITQLTHMFGYNKVVESL